jgi:hypothetical protein
VHLFRLGATDSDKVSFYLLIHVKISRGVQRNCIFWMLILRPISGVNFLVICLGFALLVVEREASF